MNSLRSLPFLTGILAAVALGGAPATRAAVSVATASTTPGIDLPVRGKLKPRTAAEIGSSSWSVGAETIDRGFTNYNSFKAYLGPLGVKAIRLQAGWARTEKTSGVYDWSWLDPIVDDAVAQGVHPWLEFSYGNPLYPGGGDTGLGGGFPSSPEALAAWDRWVRATVERYRDRVSAWEVWNEPDNNSRGTAPVEAYIDLYIRTATIVRELQPTGQLYAVALASTPEYAEKFLAGINARNRLALVDAVTVHGYPRNPDNTAIIDRLRAFIAPLGRNVQLRQGETGAPSRYQDNFALRGIAWTENTQAKWDLRRMLAHHAKDVPMNLFTLSDMHYTQATNTSGKADGILRMNYKGLVGTNPDQTVGRVKLAYSAAQGVFSIFDDELARLGDFPFTTTALRDVALTGYVRMTTGGQVVAYWFNDAPPAEANGVDLVDVTLPKGRFTEPVLVDLRTSLVYTIPKERWSQNEKGAIFKALPVYDSPLVLAEAALLHVE